MSHLGKLRQWSQLISGVANVVSCIHILDATQFRHLLQGERSQHVILGQCSKEVTATFLVHSTGPGQVNDDNVATLEWFIV